MYPESTESALAEQLHAERAISDLVELALELWLPLAEKAVLQAAASPPLPDPTAAADASAQWDYLVDALIVYGIGIVAADAYMAAYRALTGAPLTTGEAAVSGLGFDMPGMPTRDQLARRAGNVLKRRLSINVTAVEQAMAGAPSLLSFVSEHAGNVRRRVVDAINRVYDQVRRITDTAPGPDVAREQVAGVFNPRDPRWQAAADEAGQTHGTGTLNAALEQAARDSGRSLEIAWVAILDSHTRAAHADANGQRRAPGVAFDVGGEDLRFPGDPLGDLDNTINCRCRLFAYFTSANPDLVAAIKFAEAWSGKPYVFGGGEADGLGYTGAVEHALSHASEKVDAMTDYRSFTSVLAVIGQTTDDGRMFAHDIALSFRDFPLPLMWCRQSSGGHYDAFTVGVIESAGVVGTEVIGKGYLLNTTEADEAAVQIEHGVTGPSVDLGDVDWELRDANGQPITEEMWWDNPDMEVVYTVLSAKVLGATLVATPAFGQTSIDLGERVAKGEESLTAAAALIEVAKVSPVYDAALFADPGFTEPTYPHITEGGRIQGHLAAWNVCHVGIQDRCVLAPRSQTDYAWFHTSPPVQLADGGKVKVGRLTVGGGHAGPKLGVGPTIEHYDNVGTCFALVHVGEDEHGIWFSGIPAPGATPEQIAQGLAAPLSGDWRNVGGNLELVAALSVNTPGFPLVASGATDEEDRPLSLVASLGPCASQSPDGADRLNLSEDQIKAFVQIVVEETRAADRRESEARELIAGEVRRQALALIERAD